MLAVLVSAILLQLAVACYVCDKSYALIGGLQDFPIGLTGAPASGSLTQPADLSAGKCVCVLINLARCRVCVLSFLTPVQFSPITTG